MAHRRLLLCPLLLLLLVVAAPARAEAGVLVSGATGCGDEILERPFVPWLDPAQYVLAPDGAFTGGAAGWRLDGADVIAENEPYGVRGNEPQAALSVRAGGSATSPAMCVGLLHPTLRLFARNTGSLLGSLGVEVLFEDAAGNVRALPIGVIAGVDSWRPTLPMPVVANLLGLLPGARTAIAFRFTPQGVGSRWLIDDVYVDPYGKG